MNAAARVANLYVHFPFCRRKCRYCALLSRVGQSEDCRRAYVARLVRDLAASVPADHVFRTVYFGGGTPTLCDLAPLLDALAPHRDAATEFSVELHPEDVASDRLKRLSDGGVNRISMGVQSLDDDILAHMNRGYRFHDAERAFACVKEHFDNAGIDLIVGYPGETAALTPRHARLAKWGLRHCSVYSLILEEHSILGRQVAAGTVPTAAGTVPVLPSDDETLNRISVVARFLGEIGLERYEISNYATPGYECRHNLAVWRGEDYLGLGEGAYGRLGLTRTVQERPAGDTHTAPVPPGDHTPSAADFVCTSSMVTPEEDTKERALFRLRTREGLDAAGRPDWIRTLSRFAEEGFVTRRDGDVFRLTERGTEVCDAILTELV